MPVEIEKVFEGISEEDFDGIVKEGYGKEFPVRAITDA